MVNSAEDETLGDGVIKSINETSGVKETTQSWYNNRMLLSRRSRLLRTYRRQKFTTKVLILFTGLFLIGVIFMLLTFAWFARDLPSPGKLTQINDSATIFYDRNDNVLFELYKDKNRLPVAAKNISNHIKNATVAIEDKQFYSHKGISQSGILRAVYAIVTKQGLQGGSTITQQLIKNVLLDSQRTAARKIKEVILAVEVERRYSKEQILELYLNEAPYGGNFWGIGSASKGYFNKSSKDVTIVEAAFLAGLPQRPSYFSPFIGQKDAWKNRTKSVLRRMREDGYITSNEEKTAIVQLSTLKFSSPKLSINAPHFVFYVKELIEKEYGVKILDRGIRVKTTLSSDVQKIAEKITNEEIVKLKKSKVGNGAVIVLDSRTGEVLAMVGSYDFNDDEYGKFNAALGLRQPGSTIKPITYAVALEKGYTPSTVLMDVKTEFPDVAEKKYEPVNYDNKFRGPIQMRFALANSINIPAVKMLAMVGIEDFLRKADEMGVTTFAPTQTNLNRFGLSITLGGGESTLLDMTSAFSVFARGGTKKDPFTVREIKDHKGKTIFKAKKNFEKQVVTPEVTYLISQILSDNSARADAFGTNSYLNVAGKTVAVKTGTSNDKRDNWTIGYTNDLTVGVWVGNNDNSPMDQKIASGITGASPIWHSLMRTLLSDKQFSFKDGIIQQPSKIKQVTVDAYVGGLPKEGFPTRSEYFIEGSEPKTVSPFYKKLKISKANGKLANDIELRSGQYEEKEFIVITENDPVSTDNKNRWQEGINAWIKEQADKGNDKFKYPTDMSDANSDSVVVNVTEPKNETTLSSNQVMVKARITSNEKIKHIRVLLNDSEVKKIDGDNKELNETIPIPDGIYDLKVVATNEKDKNSESSVRIGVNTPWNEQPTEVPVITDTITPTL